MNHEVEGWFFTAERGRVEDGLLLKRHGLHRTFSESGCWRKCDQNRDKEQSKNDQKQRPPSIHPGHRFI